MKLFKKLSTVFVLLIATSCTPAFADREADLELYRFICNDQKVLAKSIMTVRQGGMSKQHLVMKILQDDMPELHKGLGLAAVELAYKMPLVKESSVEFTATMFAEDIYKGCYKGLSGQPTKRKEPEEWLKL